MSQRNTHSQTIASRWRIPFPEDETFGFNAEEEIHMTKTRLKKKKKKKHFLTYVSNLQPQNNYCVHV